MEKISSLKDYLQHLTNNPGIHQNVAIRILQFDNPSEVLDTLMHCGCSTEDILSSGTYSSLQDFYTAHETEILALYIDSDLDLDESDPIRYLSCFAFEDVAWQIYYYFHHVW